MGAVTIETITVTRPMKVIAFTACVITVFFVVASCSTSDWVSSDGWHEGLFKQCASAGANLPMPFDGIEAPGCTRSHSAGYVKGCAALMIIAAFTDFFGTLLTGLGLRSTDPNKKYKYYRVAIYSLIVSLIALFLAVIIYPVSFSKDMAKVSPYNGDKLDYARDVGDFDFDNDGIMDHIDNDDDNDGIPDDVDNDDDNDGINDDVDDDDDNDGIPDHLDSKGDSDFDNDGIPDSEDNDDDNDGVIDSEDNDDDNDGIPDNIDNDDDNDGIIDDLEDGDYDDDDEDDDDSLLDDDNDGIPNSEDGDDDNDGIIDSLDLDDDNDGIPDTEEISGKARVWSFGFGYGAAWASAILIFLSVILLICDRESEEIFYKERPADEEEGEE